MAEILSQSEIDQLLLALSSGVEMAGDIGQKERHRVRPYDFRTANRIPRDQIRTLGQIFETCARLLSTRFTGILGTFCECTLASVEEQTHYEFTNSIPAQSLLVLIRMPPLQGPALLCISPEMANLIVECTLGGDCRHSPQARPYTEIDLAILEKFIRQMLPLLDEAWGKIVRIETRFESLETSLQYAQIAPPSEAMAILTLKLTIGEVDSLFNFCLPQAAIEPVASSLNTSILASGGSRIRTDETCRASLLQSLSGTMIPIRGILSETTLTVRDLINLQPGDVIHLDSRLDDPIQVHIGPIPRLTGKLGTLDQRYAIKITGINEEASVHG
jgi:flagellar motor switch protein FliM